MFMAGMAFGNMQRVKNGDKYSLPEGFLKHHLIKEFDMSTQKLCNVWCGYNTSATLPGHHGPPLPSHTYCSQLSHPSYVLNAGEKC
mgnify:CR=1 FL=1